MKKIVFVLITFYMLVGCAPMPIHDTAQKEMPVIEQREISDTAQKEIPDTARTLEIDGKTFDKYTLWGCSEYSGDGPILIQLAITDITVKDILKTAQEVKAIQLDKDIIKASKEFQEHKLGFILFDGRKESVMALYKREGINHRWDWEEGHYSFVIKPDGTGLYYDFTNVKSGTTKARDVFKCKHAFSNLD